MKADELLINYITRVFENFYIKKLLAIHPI